VNVCVHYVCRNVFSLSARPRISNGKETGCLCVRAAKCTRCRSLYILKSEKVAKKEGKEVQRTEVTVVSLLSGACDAWPHTDVPHLLSST